MTDSNCIALNGIIISDIEKVGDGYLAFYLEGSSGEEFPIIILKEKMRNCITKSDKISAVGCLKKVNEEWCIELIKFERIIGE